LVDNNIPKGSDLIVIEFPHLIQPRLRVGLDPVKINCASRVLNNTPKDDRQHVTSCPQIRMALKEKE
jgi:hypothetical protein